MTSTYSTNDDDPTGNERVLLEAFLDHHRAALVAKVRDVSEDDARVALPG